MTVFLPFSVETPALYGFARSSYTVTEGEGVELKLEAYELLPATTTFTLRVVEGNATQGWYVHTSDVDTYVCCAIFHFCDSSHSLCIHMYVLCIPTCQHMCVLYICTQHLYTGPLSGEDFVLPEDFSFTIMGCTGTDDSIIIPTQLDFEDDDFDYFVVEVVGTDSENVTSTSTTTTVYIREPTTGG